MRTHWERFPFQLTVIWKALGLGLCLYGLGSGCTRGTPPSPAQRPPAVQGQPAEGSPHSKVVHVAIWSNYLSPQRVAQFEKQTGIRVLISHYSSNEELLAKLQAGASGYDVAVPSDYMVLVMRKLQLLETLDFKKLPEFQSLDPKFLHRDFDPEQTHSVPYNWSTTGLAIRKDRNLPRIASWKALFEQAELAGKFSLLDDSREVIGAALRAQGFSMNSRNVSELQAAKELLLKTRGRIKAFTSEPKMPLIHGEFAVSQVYSSDALQAEVATQGQVDYVVPEDGCTLSVESLVIPKGATHLEEAHAFMNFLLSAESNQWMTRTLRLAPVNRQALLLLPAELQRDLRIFPPPIPRARCEMIQDLGESGLLWDRIWTEVKAQRD